MAGQGLAIDIHAHALMPAVEPLVAGQPGQAQEQARQAQFSGRESAEHNRQLFATTYLSRLTDRDSRLRAMDAMGIDRQAVSVSPTQYYYWAAPELAGAIVRVANEQLAELCASQPDRFVGLGTVALQEPALAVEQLGYAVRTLGLRGVIVSTAINGVELADPRNEPVWARAEELEALVFIHPLGCSLGERIAPYYLSNVIGQPLETTIALSKLIFAGVLDRYPRLKLCAAHGGGYLPFYRGRSDHAYQVRPESRTMRQAPSAYLKRIWFDSLVYRPDTLGHLIQQVGASQVVLGTDYPFDMGVDDPLGPLGAVEGLSEADRQAIRGGNAARLLKLEGTS